MSTNNERDLFKNTQSLLDPREFFETEPRIGYHAQRRNWGQPYQQNFHERQFNNVWDEYQGRLGATLWNDGRVPSIEEGEGWGDFLQNYDWNKAYYNAPRNQRAEGFASNYNPVTRYVHY